MDLQEALLNRRTVHHYLPEAVDESIIMGALEAAIRAPNHKLTNPWRFTIVGPQVRRQLVDLGVELKRQKKNGLSPRATKILRAKYANPAYLIVVSQVLDDDSFRRREDYAAVCCAIQNLCLHLWGEGVASKWSTGSVTRHEDTYTLLEINADDEDIVGFVWAGVPEDIPDPPRRPLQQVVRRTR